MWCTFLMSFALANADVSDLKTDETIVFFPALGRFVPNENVWEIQIHAWIFEPERDSLKRAAALGVLRRTLGLDEDAAGTALFKERARAFLVDNQRGKKVVIRLAGATYTLPESEPNGRSEGTFRVPESAIRTVARSSLGTAKEAKVGGDSTVPFEAVLHPGDSRRLGGFVSLLAPSGLSVISDIDDTIKVSQVTDKKALLANTFTREFRPVAGMAALYQALADRGASFHYVTASPWQLYEPLSAFLAASGFPAGTFHMKQFRMKDSSFLSLFSDPEKGKPLAIEPILRAFPGRGFVLIGDSGEKDPEVYGALARKFQGQIVHIFIRNATGERSADQRFVDAFAGVPQDRWTLFDEPAGLIDLIRASWSVVSRPTSASKAAP